MFIIISKHGDDQQSQMDHHHNDDLVTSLLALPSLFFNQSLPLSCSLTFVSLGGIPSPAQGHHHHHHSSQYCKARIVCQ